MVLPRLREPPACLADVAAANEQGMGARDRAEAHRRDAAGPASRGSGERTDPVTAPSRARLHSAGSTGPCRARRRPGSRGMRPRVAASRNAPPLPSQRASPLDDSTDAAHRSRGTATVATHSSTRASLASSASVPSSPLDAREGERVRDRQPLGREVTRQRLQQPTPRAAARLRWAGVRRAPAPKVWPAVGSAPALKVQRRAPQRRRCKIGQAVRGQPDRPLTGCDARQGRH